MKNEFPPQACDVSVVVLSYNSAETIRRCLDSLAGQVTSRSFEVLLIDSSTDATAAIVEREYPWVKLLRQFQRFYPGQARNVGIRHASGGIVAFLASDCVAHPDWLETRFRRHEEGYAGVGGAITNANPESVVGWANYFMEYLYSLPTRPREEIRGKLIHNLSYARELFARHGLFPGNLQLGEDTIFNRRLMLAEVPVLFEPAVRTGHINPTRLAAFLAHQFRHGLDFARACRAGELAFFKIPATCLQKIASLYLPLVRYPLMRIQNTVRLVARDRTELLPRLFTCFPILLAGIVASAGGVVAGYFERGAGEVPFSQREEFRATELSPQVASPSSLAGVDGDDPVLRRPCAPR